MKVLIDTNVIVDFMIDREPFAEHAYAIIEKCSLKEIDGYMAAHSIPNLFYILRNAYPVKKRKELLLELCNILEVIGIDKQKVIASILNNSLNDLEDCLQIECAKEIGADYIITRNMKDFRESEVEAILTENFLKLF